MDCFTGQHIFQDKEREKEERNKILSEPNYLTDHHTPHLIWKKTP